MTLYQKVLESPEEYDFAIPNLGERKRSSPIKGRQFATEDRVLFSQSENALRKLLADGRPLPSYEKAGPREKIFHDPSGSRAAIVTCGGLCPGLNDVIKGIVNTLHFAYGVKSIQGIRYGYRGFISEYRHEPVELTPEVVGKIHEEGGTILGSSRGGQDTGAICDTLQRMNINMLFCVGGDGTLRGAGDIADECSRRNQPISVIGVPKTIDNDLSFIGRSFGFETSVYSTTETLTSAHVEAKGSLNGIGLVKLMGRDSGFIAAAASLANSVVNFCLIPEVLFELDGERGLLKALEHRFESGKDHAVIVVAEGAGQHLFENRPETQDASGNVLKNDIGVLLKQDIADHFDKIGVPCSIKYFDPSYSIRSVPAFGTDAIFCYGLAENAAHAAMAGCTRMVVGMMGKEFVHVPIRLATMERQSIDPASYFSAALHASTGQLQLMGPVLRDNPATIE
jgi:6-phosphofructokinase 1